MFYPGFTKSCSSKSITMADYKLHEYIIMHVSAGLQKIKNEGLATFIDFRCCESKQIRNKKINSGLYLKIVFDL